MYDNIECVTNSGTQKAKKDQFLAFFGLDSTRIVLSYEHTKF